MRVCAILLLMLLLGLSSGCASYQIGADSMFRPDVRTVYVPMFESDSFRPHLGERLTEAVVKRVEQVTPYKVVSSPNADSVLSGRIVRDTKRVITENRFDDARDLEHTVTVDITWADRRGNVLAAPGPIGVPLALLQLSSTANFVPEAGQSLGTAQHEALDRLAKQIVDQLETPW